MVYDKKEKVFQQKMTSLQIRPANSETVIAEAEFDLAEHINIKIENYKIDLDDVKPRVEIKDEPENESQ